MPLIIKYRIIPFLHTEMTQLDETVPLEDKDKPIFVVNIIPADDLWIRVTWRPWAPAHEQ